MGENKYARMAEIAQQLHGTEPEPEISSKRGRPPESGVIELRASDRVSQEINPQGRAETMGRYGAWPRYVGAGRAALGQLCARTS